MGEENGDTQAHDADDGEEVVVFATRPVEPGEEALRVKFFERYADQAKQMDELGRQMITIELAVPGIYAAVLALLQGQNATLGSGWLVTATFGLWFVSMVLTFVSLFPRKYKVDPSILIGEEQGMGVATFFRKSAEYKRRLLIAAALIFWLGIVAALFLMLGIGAGSTP